jgi:hypothetical protein
MHVLWVLTAMLPLSPRRLSVLCAERRGATLCFPDIARVGILLTLLQTIVYWLFL